MEPPIIKNQQVWSKIFPKYENVRLMTLIITHSGLLYFELSCSFALLQSRMQIETFSIFPVFIHVTKAHCKPSQFPQIAHLQIGWIVGQLLLVLCRAIVQLDQTRYANVSIFNFGGIIKKFATVRSTAAFVCKLANQMKMWISVNSSIGQQRPAIQCYCLH